METATQRAEGTGDGQIQSTAKVPQEESFLTGSHLPLVTGLVLNTKGLGLEAAGVETEDRGFVGVNGWLGYPFLRHVYPRAHFVGRCCGVCFTHLGLGELVY